MMFCPKCGSFLIPKKEEEKVIVRCSCGYNEIKPGEVKVKELIKKKAAIEAVEKEVEVHPLVEAECPKCGHDQAYFWEIQTRASDEPATKFFRCEKCRHICRDYK